jgi:ornithine carbamoyltransferase
MADHPHPDVKGRSVLSLMHHSPEAIAAVLDTATTLAGTPRAQWPRPLAGTATALIFERPSTRTRVSFDVGITHLGGHALTLSAADMQLGRGETIEDTAKVLSRMVDAIMLRSASHQTLVDLAKHASVPVINGLTPAHHPCQALADALTLRQRFGDLRGLPIAYVGDGNNCCVSLMVVGALTGMAMTAACPPGYTPDPEIVAWVEATAPANGGSVRVVNDPREGVVGARAIYGDTWVSMGDEEDSARRLSDLDGYRIDDALMDAAAPDCIALHPLPAHHGEEITYDVLHGSRSAVWDQAENRIHAQAALLAHILGK